MAQFDVHHNPGRSRQVIPFLLVVQSDRWEDRADRIVVPLARADEVPYRDVTLNPVFEVEGDLVVMNPLQIATVPRRVLGDVVASLDGAHGTIIAALDAAIAQGR